MVFHMDKGCSTLLTWLDKHALKSLPDRKVPYGRMVEIVLAIGLAIRDITKVLTREDDSYEILDSRFQKSLLTLRDLNSLTARCESICGKDLYVVDLVLKIYLIYQPSCHKALIVAPVAGPSNINAGKDREPQAAPPSKPKTGRDTEDINAGKGKGKDPKAVPKPMDTAAPASPEKRRRCVPCPSFFVLLTAS
jgi:hypothetical protein